MGWPLRMFEEEGFYFVTSRCMQGRLLLRPSDEVNEVVGGVLGRALQHSGGNVRLHGFTFVSNHFHLLLWARGSALSSFMQYLRSNLAKKIGRLVDWSGSFWERRYSVEPVLDDGALLRRLSYILAHGVKEGLVARCSDWPGLTCLPQLLGPSKRTFRWFNWTKRYREGHGSEADGRFAHEWAEPVEVEVAPLPCWAGLSEKARHRAVRALVAEVEAKGASGGQAPLGAYSVRAQPPHTRPARLKRSPRPLGHATARAAIDALRERYLAFVAAFREASARWRWGDFSVSFPPFSFPPRFIPDCLSRAPLPATV